MAPRKTYRQFCGLARALDHIGDRWTLLIVRELLVGPTTFADLQDALAGISSTLLIDRLRHLTADGLAERSDAPVRSKSVTYSLTSAGRELEPAILCLIRWGARWMTTGPGEDHVDPAWSSLALKALLAGDTRETRKAGFVHVEADDFVLTIHSAGRTRRVEPGGRGTAGARVVGTLVELLAVASGTLRLDDTSLAVSGDHFLAARSLEP